MQSKLHLEPEIVISGISGRYPQSDNVDEFWQNLIDGKDMVCDGHNRFFTGGLVIPPRMGFLKSLDKFDAEFFSVHAKQSNVLDPRLRKLLEVTHEAIIDAGIHPSKLHGTGTGVFVAVSDSEAAAIWKRSGSKTNVYGVLGNAVSMMANRISYNFGLHGPSYIVDTACSSASVAIQHAFHSIRTGLCEDAIVAGAHTHHDPVTSMMFHHLEMTSADGKCKVFDNAADGYARAEAVAAIYICKRQVAKRAYATLVHAGINNDGYKEQGVTFPSEIMQEKVIRKVYSDIGLDPVEVDYLEAHGTGTKVGDPEEMAAATNIFCKGRDGPLLVGSVKSNMGHPEPVAGLCAITKVILSHVEGIVPANLHYNTPNAEIPGLHDGRLKVIDQNQPFSAKYVGLNSMGFGGTNVHILLRLQNQDKKDESWTPSIPMILLTSGRTEEAVNYFFERSLANQKNQHFVKLVHELSKGNIQRHYFRGFVITDSEKTDTVVESFEQKDTVWFIFTGMGSQWAGMSKDLIKFDVFKKSLEKSAEFLSNNNFDLMGLLQSGETSKFDDFINAMVAINSVQVALVDLLKSIGIEPDGIIGHSTGEVSAGYTDGCLSQKETVLTSLARARSFFAVTLPPGTVASVGLTWEEAHRRCPEGVYPAIHNARENVTIAGPPDVVKEFMKQLESEGIFAKAIRSALFGFHSPLVAAIKPVSQALLRDIITEPKLRSKKWLSSSVPENLWGTEAVKYCSADYYVNNGINSVYFYPTLLQIPENSIALEIAPHCFMLSILKQSLPKNCVSLGLIHVKSPDNCRYFLHSVGTCYNHGVNVDIGALYEPVQFPVSSKTPNISSMIKWDYSDTWYVPHNSQELSKQKGMKYQINMHAAADQFFEGHTLEGKIVFPATGYLWLVWRFFSSELYNDVDSCPVVFENVRFERITFMNKRKESEFLVNILQGSGKFEIIESEMVVCSGIVRQTEGSFDNETLNSQDLQGIDISGPNLNKDDFYKEMHLRGYGHKGQFQGIKEIHTEGNWSKVEWPGHWVSFLDSVLQTYVLQSESRDLLVPTRVKKMIIDPLEVKAHLADNENQLTVKAWKIHDTGSCPGLEVQGLSFAKFNLKSSDIPPTTTEQVFVPYLEENKLLLSYENALEACVEIAVDNSFGGKFVFTEILSNSENMISDMVISQCRFSFTAFDFTTVNESQGNLDEEKLKLSGSKDKTLKDLQSSEPNHLIFVDDLKYISEVETFVLPGGFMLFKGSSCPKVPSDFRLAAEKNFMSNEVSSSFFLLRKLLPVQSKVPHVILTDTSDFKWVEDIQHLLKSLEEIERVVLASNLATSGIIGFVRCLVKETRSDKIKCYQTIDCIELEFDKPSTDLETQLRKDLIFNVHKNGLWGYFANQLISPEEFQKQRVSPRVFANALRIGDLGSLSWIESPLKYSQTDLVEVHYSSLNFRDIMLATGRLNQASAVGVAQSECILGLEFSGQYKGKRVFGMGSSQCLATHVDPSNLILFDIPDKWSYEEAATVPAVYVTVYLALVIRGRMQPGESILIHAGSGGVGQAAISIALSMNCRVFTTVSTQKKREFLKERFPALADESFTNSRDPREFKRHIKEQTKGKGVNLILNSLAQESLKASIDCLSDNGRFLEIGKFDLFNDTNIGLSTFLKGTSFIGILADKIIEDGPSKELDELMKLMKEGIASGDVRPLNYTIFKYDELEQAFRFMAQGKHMGKILLQIKEKENSPAMLSAYPRTYFHPNKSYIILGGLGGMGFELANWMTQRGAEKLVLVSRTGTLASYHQYRIRTWEKYGIKILISQSDSGTTEGTRALLQEASELGPVGGIFNSAVLLKDALLENQTPETFADSARCKADATANLDLLSRQLAPELDYFVVFSSIAAGRGNPGQTNYGYSNSVMERICEQRKADGLPALAIQWGAVGDVGVLYRQIGDRDTFAGLIPQKFKSCLETLDLYLQQERPVVSSFIAVKQGDLTTFDAKESLVDIAARILGIKDIKKVNPKATLVDLGMDSLMAAELSQVLSSRSTIQIPAKSYTQLTFEKLAELEGKAGLPVQEDHTIEILRENFKTLLKIRKLNDKPLQKMESLSITDENLFIVHPLDGTLATLETLVKNLNYNVYGLECVKDVPLDSIENLATFYLKNIQQVQSVGPYNLAGYSFGAQVAFEMALQLERQNETVSMLMLLDGTPKWRDMVEAASNVGGMNKRQNWENAVLTSLLELYIGTVSLNVYKELDALGTVDQKWNHAAGILSEAYPDISKEEINAFIGSFLARGNISAAYKAGGKIKAKTVLLKATQTGVDKDVVAHDYGISEVCELPIEIVEIDGNHYCFHEKPIELGIPQVINTILGKNQNE